MVLQLIEEQSMENKQSIKKYGGRFVSYFFAWKNSGVDRFSLNEVRSFEVGMSRSSFPSIYMWRFVCYRCTLHVGVLPFLPSQWTDLLSRPI